MPDHFTCFLRNLYVGQEAIIRPGHGTTDCFKVGKEHDWAVYCDLVYLTYMKKTSCKMLGYMNHKLESRLPEEISTSHMQMIPLTAVKDFILGSKTTADCDCRHEIKSCLLLEKKAVINLC